MKKFLSLLILIILLTILFSVLINSNEIINIVKYSYNIWINNIFPSLFPFLVLSDLLINYGFVEFISEIFKPIFTKLFKINGNASFVFFMSMVSGFPSNAKNIKELYLQNKLDLKECNKILMFSHFSNPLFVLSIINNFELKYKISILFSHYFANVIIGIIIRNYNAKTYNNKISLKNALNNMHNKRINNDNFGTIITNSLINSIDTLLLILGIVTTCLIITTIIENIFNLPIFYKTIINSILELTQGLKFIELLNCSNYYKGLLITSILSFGGLSVHLQVMSILNNIKYKNYLLARILHVIISILLYCHCSSY